MNCRISKKPLTELFSLGELYISDFILNDDDYRGKGKYDLTMMLSAETKSLQLKQSVEKDLMYGKYWYRSGTNASMKKELKEIAEEAIKLHRDKPQKTPFVSNKVFLDIASNDGTLLGNVPADDFLRIGIDPVKGYDEALAKSDLIIEDYFSKKVWDNKIGKNIKADIITCIAMFYDLDDPLDFLGEVNKIISDDGLFIIQQSYMPLMIQQLAFDNICHEHVFYHSLHSMEYMLKKTGFKIVDAKLNDVNGGSFRLYIQKESAKPSSFYTAPYRDVARMRVDSLRIFENSLKLDEIETYDKFYNSIIELKDKTSKFIKDEHAKGKTTWIYGASTKGNTLLQWFNLDHQYIEAAAERSPYKYGLKTIGTNIPIFSEEMMRQKQPDYLLVLPWHFINEFKDREYKYLKRGGKMIIPCPEFSIIK